ncbi:MAG: hypothetical protein GYB67_16355 [Chloroflexi bacterium]|nr:hypothetical protein [Chloroflexota bacterium]
MLELWIEGTIDEVAQVANSGLAAAIATNPSIIARWTADGASLVQVVAAVCAKTHTPVYVQLHGPDADSYAREMEALLEISDQIHPKLVATRDGIAAVRRMKALGRKPLITTVATLNQAFMAAAVGADYIAPYVGRIAAAGRDSNQLIHDIAQMYARNNAATQITAASIRTPAQAEEALRAGANQVVMGYTVFEQLLNDDLTHNWIEVFEENWRSFDHALEPSAVG